MEFAFDQDQLDLRSTLKAFLTTNAPSAVIRQSLDTGADPGGLWERLAGQLELPSVSIPIALGGAGGSAVEQAIAFEELGAALVPGRYLATVGLASSLVVACQDDAAAHQVLPGLLGPSSTGATFAWSGMDGAALTRPAATGSISGDVVTITGAARSVLDGAMAGLILVLVDTDQGPSLVALASNQEGVVTEPLHSLDLTRSMADLQFVDALGRVIGAPGRGIHIVGQGLEGCRIALCAEQVGGAQACLDLTIDYIRLRHQFGRPIGSFQAVKHKAADMLVRVELARSTAYYAAWAVAQGWADAALWTSIASSYCSEAYLKVATDTIQLHGGIGFTWEHDAHLHFRRAKADHALLGSPRWHRDRVATMINSKGAA